MIAPVPMPIVDPEETLSRRETWDEHQRRQRSIRMLMMFLMMLILMDGEEPHTRKKSLRGKRKKRSSHKFIEKDLWKKRVELDEMIWEVGMGHDRFQNIVELNNGTDEASSAFAWAEKNIWTSQQHDNDNKEKLVEKNKVQAAKEAFDIFQVEEKLVHHYPRNATGSYRGTWKRVLELNNTTKNIFPNDNISSSHDLDNAAERNATHLHVISDEDLLAHFPSNHIGLHILPPRTRLDEIVHKNGASATANQTRIINGSDKNKTVDDMFESSSQTLDVTKDEGSMVVRLYTRKVTGMNQVSLVDGVVILYDVNDRSFTSHMKHLTLRVRGIVLHSLGKISLVANDGPLRSAFVINNGNAKGRRKGRRNLQAEPSENDKVVEDLRDDVLSKHDNLFGEDVGGKNWTMHFEYGDPESASRRLRSGHGYVGSNPFLPDDTDGTLYTTPSNVLRATSTLVRGNGLGCEFELDFNTTETKWTRKEWRTMLKSILVDTRKADPQNLVNQTKKSKDKTTEPNLRRREDSIAQANEDLIMHMIGTITSKECNFVADVNVTAIRTDWDRTSTKAINYCFFMMIACLAQTVFILRQMIYSQAQSAAVRVSLITVGWQTVLDAILCIEHIFLCLVLQPVSTAFAMVAFLKLLIFCVIEMKYMVMIMQARLNAAGINLAAADLRRRVTALHFRFYIILMTLMVILWHFREKHRTMCLLGMYSFWVPQIIQNTVAETRSPLHKNYVYGMTATRLFAPLYTLAFPGNFFLEIEPDFPIDYVSCKMLIIWVGLQVSIIAGQNKYGPRFMIPARFLPPKYNYHRPIPSSLIPKPTITRIKSEAMEMVTDPLLDKDVLSANDTQGPRNRKEKRNRNGNETNNGITTINHTDSVEQPTLDCVICYNEIDIGHRFGYMLAPCNHIFHKECLAQWMEVKMECPVCRTDLPAL